MDFKTRFQYDSSQPIGVGGFSRVYKAWDTLLEREVAIKIFPTVSQDARGNVVDEIRKAVKLQHPNLLSYYDVVLLENINAIGEKGVMQIGIMEYANRGDLKSFIASNRDPRLIHSILIEILRGLGYLHRKGMIHRDLKPQNILLSDSEGYITAKIADFGISKDVLAGNTQSSALLGTIEYMAPEQFNPAAYGIDGKIGTSVDLWSFGVLAYEIITGEKLFGDRTSGTSQEEIMSAILSKQIPAGVFRLIEPYQTIIRSCLVTDAKSRVNQADYLLSLLERGQSFVPSQMVPRAVAPVSDNMQEATQQYTGRQKETIPADQISISGQETSVASDATQLIPKAERRSIETEANLSQTQSDPDKPAAPKTWGGYKLSLLFAGFLFLVLFIVIGIKSNEAGVESLPTSDSTAADTTQVPEPSPAPIPEVILWNENGTGSWLDNKTGLVYKVASIDDRTWMAENYNSPGAFLSGTKIREVTSPAEWQDACSKQLPAYCWFDYDIKNRACGRIYNIYAVREKQLFPEGWHIPTYDELHAVIRKGVLAVCEEWPYAAPNNSTGFSAFPFGYIDASGNAVYKGTGSWWWTSDETRLIDGVDYYDNISVDTKNEGYFVRCIKD
jgi:uncharacterized protein (TIGR02145 family)